MAESVRILDAHVHQWDPYTNPMRQSPVVKLLGWSPALMERAARLLFPRVLADFVGKPDYALATYLPDDLMSDWGEYADRIDGVVHVQPGWKLRRHVDAARETAWLESIDPEMDLFEAIVGEVLLEREDLDAALDAHERASARFVGARQPLAASDDPEVASLAHGRHLMRDPAWQQGFVRLGERGLTFDAWIYHHQIDDLVELTRTFPDTPVVVDHLCSPVAIAGPYGGLGASPAARSQIEAAWMRGIERLAEVDHLRFKVSGQLMPVAGHGIERWPARMSQREFLDQVGPRLEWFIDTVGIDRCMWASNFPMDKVSIDYVTLLAGMEELVAGRDTAERAAFFAGNARAFYGIEVEGSGEPDAAPMRVV